MLSLLTTDEAVGDFNDAAMIARTGARSRFQHPTRGKLLYIFSFILAFYRIIPVAASTGNILNKAHQILKPTIQLYLQQTRLN